MGENWEQTQEEKSTLHFSYKQRLVFLLQFWCALCKHKHVVFVIIYGQPRRLSFCETMLKHYSSHTTLRKENYFGNWITKFWQIKEKIRWFFNSRTLQPISNLLLGSGISPHGFETQTSKYCNNCKTMPLTSVPCTKKEQH